MMVRRLLAFGAVLLTLACDQRSTAIGEAKTKAPEPTGPAAIIMSPSARGALAEGEVWLVDDGTSPLATDVKKNGPALVVHFVDDEQPILYNRLHRATFRGRASVAGQGHPVKPEVLSALGLEPPTDRVWVFGPRGSCVATVGQPWVGRAASGRVFEVSYALEGCGFEGHWAPFASSASSMPRGLTWVDAQVSADEPFGVDERWEHPLGESVEYPDGTGNPFVAHARWVELQPRPAQALVTAVDEPCVRETHRATFGWWRPEEREFEAVDAPWLNAGDPPLLVGALGWGSDPVALVFDDGLDGLVAVFTQSEENAWSVRPLRSGRWTASAREQARLRVGCDAEPRPARVDPD